MVTAKPTSMQALREFALRLPETGEGIACKGTAFETCTIWTNGRAFLFLRPIDARLKLSASSKDAGARAAKEPERYEVDTGGWVEIRLDGANDRLDVLERWVAESHGLFRLAKSGVARGSGKRA